jgi:WD40 repeat protein
MNLFVSYSRADAAGLARRLTDDLRASGFNVWLDQDGVLGGYPFVSDITSNLDQADIVLALLSFDSTNSNWCTCEHLHALRKHKPIIPIKVQSEVDPPLYFENLQWLDFGNAQRWATDIPLLLLPLLVDQPAVSPPPRFRTTPALALPPLPGFHVPRSTVVADVADLLVRDHDPVRLVAVTGVLGMGKSTLANLVSRDQHVQAAFPDGIVWCPLEGQTDLLSALREAGTALGDNIALYTAQHTASTRLRTFVSEKAVLFVLDGVRSVEDVEAFRNEAPRSKILISTRDAGIASFEGAADYKLRCFTEDESVGLLRQYRDSDDSHFVAIANRLERLPIAIRMAGALLREGAQPADLLRQLGAGPGAALAPLDRLLDKSFSVLGPREQRFFSYLACSPRRVLIPELIANNLWLTLHPQSSAELRAALDALELAGLIERSRSGFWLHDLLRTYARKRLGDEIAAAHAAFVQACRRPGVPWWELKDEYPIRYGAYHLARSGHLGELRDLLYDARWLHAKLRATGPASLILDYRPLENVPEVATLAGAIRLSESVLAEDPSQLASQLSARLGPECPPGIQAVIRQAACQVPGPAFRPLTRSLTPPGGPLRGNLVGHTDQVNGVVLTNNRVFSVSDDRSIRSWNIRTTQVLKEHLNAHRSGIKAICATEEGLLVTASDDGAICAWDAETLEQRHSIDTRTGPIKILTTHGKGRVVSAGDDGVIRIWDLRSGSCLCELPGHSSRVRAVIAGRGGDELISGAEDGSIAIWNTALRSQVAQWSDEGMSGVWALALRPHQSRLISGHLDGCIRLWRLDSLQRTGRLESHKNAVTALLTLGNDRLVSGSADDDLTVWDLTSEQQICVLSEHAQWIRALALSPDQLSLVSASADRTLKVWETANLTSGYSPKPHLGRVTSVAISPGASHALSGSSHGTVQLWHMAPAAPPLQIRLDQPVRALALSEAAGVAVIGDDARCIRVFDLANMSERARADGISTATWIAICRSGCRALIASEDRSLLAWELMPLQARPKFLAHNPAEVTALALCSEGGTAFLASRDGSLKKLQLAGPSEELIANLPCVAIAMAVSSQDRWLALGDDGGEVVIWDCTSPFETAERFQAHTDAITGIAFLHGGEQLATASLDGTVRLWDRGSHQQLAAFHGDGNLIAMAASAEPPVVIAGEVTGAVHLLQVEGRGGVAAFASAVE